LFVLNCSHLDEFRTWGSNLLDLNAAKEFFKSPWKNVTLETIKIFMTEDLIPLLKEFILMNTLVKEIILLPEISMSLNFIKVLKWNTNLISIENHDSIPMYYFYMKRNRDLALIPRNFKKEISQIKAFNISFLYE
jgi:hypothetical protein